MHSNNSSRNNTGSKIEGIPPVSGGSAIQDELVSSTTTTSQLKQSGFGGRISFNVARRETTKVVSIQNGLVKGRNAEEDEEDDDGEQKAKKRGILSLEDGVVIDAEPRVKREKKLLVIPVLRLSTQSQIERLEKLVAEGTATESDRARLTLLRESVDEVVALEASQSRNGKIGLTDMNLQIQTGPTLVKADDTDPDYQSMPVGEFGLAFLRGCGWRDAQSCIGKSNPQAVPLRVSAPRPKGLGLGAVLPSTAPPLSSSASSSTRSDKRDGDEDEREKQLGKNSYVKCIGGLNKGAYGQVMSMDEENASVFVELAWPTSSSGKTVRVSQLAVEVVSRREFGERTKSSSQPDAMRNGHSNKRIRV